MTAKKKTGKELVVSSNKDKALEGEVVGNTLFPIPETPLGEACRKWVKIKIDIAELKKERDITEDKILAEMEKEGRSTLVVTIDDDNWLFEVKKRKKQLAVVKKTRSTKLPKKTKDDKDWD